VNTAILKIAMLNAAMMYTMVESAGSNSSTVSGTIYATVAAAGGGSQDSHITLDLDPC
jgi:hypothetical protein